MIAYFIDALVQSKMLREAKDILQRNPGADQYLKFTTSGKLRELVYKAPH